MPTAKDPDVVVEINIKQSPAAATPVSRPAVVRPPGRKRHYVLWTIFVLLVGVFLWLATSSNPFAEGIQELAGNRHDQAVVDSPFSVSAKNFRYYKFNLPEASTNVAIVGDFTVLPGAGGRKNDSKRMATQPDSGIEVYVLSESSFAVWQTGYGTSSVFQSGRIAQGKIAADLPPGAGVYYLVFSNKFSPSLAKKVDASVVLHYKNWIPGWIRQVKGELQSWIFS
jgi:hypothetical protein